MVMTRSQRLRLEAESSSENVEQEEVMRLRLKVEKTIQVEVRKSGTVRDLKTIVSSEEDLSNYPLEVYFAGNLLQDEHKLSDRGVVEGSKLHINAQGGQLVRLFITMPELRESVEIQAQSLDSVARIKELIAEKGMAPAEQQYTLFHLGKKLIDDKTLAYYHVQDGDTFQAVLDPKDALQVSVNIPGGETVHLEVQALHTIRALKVILEGVVDYSVAELDLWCEGERLDDSKTLASYDFIKEDSTLYLLF